MQRGRSRIVSEFWWGLLWLSLFIPLMFLWGFTLWDVFSRYDLSGWTKALWAVGIVFLPIFGMLMYFIARPKELDPVLGSGRASSYSMGDGRQYQRASSPSPAAADMYTINRLHDSGTITDAEFNDLKARMA